MNNSSKIIATVITSLLAIFIIVLLLLCHLNVSLTKGQQWPPVKEFEIVAEDIEDPESFVSTYNSSADDVWEQYAEVDDPAASDIDSDVDTQTSYDLNNSGSTQGHHANVSSSERPSAVQQRKVNEGTSKPDDAARLEAERQQKAKKNIDDKMANRFSGAGKGDGGKTDPKADGSKANNGPGGNEPLTYSASRDQRPRSSELGTIRIRVTVLAGGIVEKGSAKYASGSGTVATNQNTINACLSAAEKCQFSRPSNETSPRPGIVTFTWNDQKK